MSPDHDEVNQDRSPAGEAEVAATQRTANPAKGRVTAPIVSSARLWLLALAAGIGAGLIAWLIGEPVVEFFKPVTRKVVSYGMTNQLPTAESLAATEIRNAALAFAILGGVLGLALGLAGGMVRGNGRAALIAAGAGLVLGALAGVTTSYLLVPVFRARFDMVSQDLTVSLLTQGGIWGAVGAVGGLALGVGLGGWNRMGRCAAGGLAGGFLGTVVYELAGASLFPLDETYLPLSISASSRLVARLAVGVCVAVGSVVATQVSGRAKTG
jgi:hypothetical protein